MDEINNLIVLAQNGDKNAKEKLILDNKNHCGGISYDSASKSIFITGKGEKNHSYVQKYELAYLLSKDNGYELKSKYIYEVDYDNTLYSSSAKHSSPAFLNCFDNNFYTGISGIFY